MNCLTDTGVSTTTTNVASHRFIDIVISRLCYLRQQDRRAHDLARLAIAALRNVDFRPGLLQRMTEIWRESLDGCDLPAGSIRHALHAGADSLAIKVDRTSAAKRHAAAIL